MNSYHSGICHGHRTGYVGNPDLDCGPNDLIVKVLMCARCGTDKSIFTWSQNVDPYAPVVLGHG